MVLGGDVGKITKKQKELLDDIYMGNERMIRLVNDLMDASKIDEGKFALLAEPEDLEALAGEVVKEIRPFALKKKVKLEFIPSSVSLPKAGINRPKVKQVLQNLIDNAIKYSAGKDGRVTVWVQDEGKFLDFMVKDNGIGIPLADQGRIFERFYRGSNSTKLDPGGGSGLGLYIAKGVVEQGGGKIWFETKEGGGTTFHATFKKA
jgi:signal transduction histidine kinase